MRAPLLSPFRRVRPASIISAPHQPGDNLRGAALMVLSMVSFTCNDALIKYVAKDVPLYQSVTIRGAFVMLGIWLFALREEGGLRLRLDAESRGPMVLRTLAEIGSTLLYLAALVHMAIGDLSAVMQSLPLAVMLGAVFFFGETLGWRRLLAVLVGMIGVMMILRPGTDTFGIWSLVALASMLMVAARDLVTRCFGRHVSSTSIAFYAAASVTLTGLVLSLGEGWKRPDPGHVLLLLAAGGCLTAGYVSAVAAMRVGEISAVAPFRYTSLVTAIILGLVVFGEWPDLWTWVGSALVVGAGIYTIWREAQLARRV